jgi:hypothetical protein
MPDGTLAPPAPKRFDVRAPLPVLDHTAFPHLLAAVLDAAPPASLLALRGASRSLKDAADARLARHLVFAGALRTPDLSLRVPPSLYAHTRVLELHGAALEAAHEHGGQPCTGCGVRQREAVIAALLASVSSFTALHAVQLTGSLGCEWSEAVEFRRLRASWAVYAHAETDALVLSAAHVVLVFRRAVGPVVLSRFGEHVYLYLPCMEIGNPEALAYILEAVGKVVFSWRPTNKFTFVGTERWPGAPDPARIRKLLGAQSRMKRAETVRRVESLVHFMSITEFRVVAGEDVFRLVS